MPFLGCHGVAFVGSSLFLIGVIASRPSGGSLAPLMIWMVCHDGESNEIQGVSRRENGRAQL